ncbi:NlpC/P60 family protein [Leuconostoc citreum]|uniref:NlpC/P60 family protein n=1 Tax=Leuconostoc citreum TaxID=33964 RepID=UPI000BFEF3EA|nr:NlpC/P60 family protein [Leuconostoc citreum]
MADKQIIKTVATQMTLDTSSAKESLRDLTGAVKDSVSEAKILEAQYRASGDTVNASKAKYEGLQQTLDLQKTKIDSIKTALEQNNTETKKGQEVQSLLQNQLASAERQYASYQGQLDKATQSYKYQESGLADLNKELKHGNDMTEARVRALEAEGRSEDASKLKLQGLKDSQENYSKQLKIQQEELQSLAESGDKSSDSYKRQALRVEQMGAKLSETTRDIKNFNRADIKPDVSGIGKVKEQLSGLDDALEGTRNRFKSVFLGNLAANGVMNAFEGIKNKISETFAEAKEYNKEQQVMNATWTTLTDSADKGKDMVKSINQISTAFGQSNDVVNELSQQFYHVFNQKEPTDQLTKSMLTMADTLGMNAEGVERLGLNFTHMMSSTKLQLGDFNMITDQLPMYGEKLLEYEQKVQNNSKLTMDELRKQMSAGEISAKDATEVMNELGDKYKSASENMMGTASGMERVIEARGKALAGALIKPIMNAQNPIFGAISKWVSDPKTEQEFDKVGNAISKSFGTITSAFGKEFKSSDFTGGMDKALDNISDAITKFGDYVAKHKDEIIGFFKGMKALGGFGLGQLGETLKIALPLLEKLGEFAEKHPTTFKVLAGAVIGFDLALKGTLGTMEAFGKAKTAFLGVTGLFIKPKVDGSDAKRELGIISKIGKGIGKGMLWTAKLAWTGVKKSLALMSTAAKATGRAFKYTATLSTKAATKGLEALKKAGKSTGTALKTAFNFAKANPLILIATAITAVIVGLVELYKHNKKFKAFVDGLAKAASGFFKGIGKWITQAWNNAKKIFSKVVSFFKKDWKEILLFIVNPFAGAFALLYKHNDKFRKNVNNLIKSVINIVKGLGKAIGDTFNAIVKFITDCWNSITNTTRNVWNSIAKFFGDIFSNIWKTITGVFNSIVKFIANTLSSIWNTWSSTWNNVFKFFGDLWSNIKNTAHDSITAVWNTLSGILDSIKTTFKNAWNAIKDGFNDMWKGLKDIAQTGINLVIKPINWGIDHIDDLIHDFGGPEKALGNIPEVKLATGTGAFSGERRPITKPTLALLNDGVDSPETGNKEALVHPNGAMEIVQGNNVNRWLAPGTEVINAKELAMLMKPTPYAKGTGLFGDIWNGIKGAGSWVAKTASNVWDGAKEGAEKFTKMIGYITDAIAHPIKTLEDKFNPKTDNFGKLFDGMGEGIFGKAKDTAKDWWSSLWNMAKGAGEGGSSSELLNNAEKFGNGKPYVWGAAGADSFDCSGLVEYTLAQMGKAFPKYSGDQYSASTPVSNPEAGDLVFFGPAGGDHVGIYAGNGKMYSAMSPGSTPNIGMANISDWSEALSAQPYRRVPGLSASSDDVKTSNPLQSLIKGQVGSMFDWIKKTLGPLMGGGSSTGTNGNVNSWSGDVKRALQQLGLSTSDGMVQKVLRQIQTESGGNAGAMGGNDGLADGNATGLMQVKPGTFRANMLPGHGDIMNGYDNILAGLNYAQKTYGRDLSFLGNGHGYANGGLITKHQIAEIGEGNKPEMIIPLDSMKSSRGFELLGKTAVAMAARDGHQASMNSASEVSVLEDKFDKMINLLGKLVQGQANPIPAIVSANQANVEINKVKAQASTISALAKG